VFPFPTATFVRLPKSVLGCALLMCASLSSAYQFVIGEMRHNFANRPFSRSRPPHQLASRHALHQLFEFLRRCSLHFERISIAQIALQSFEVVLQRLGHAQTFSPAESARMLICVGRTFLHWDESRLILPQHKKQSKITQ
jgi:hypothetical protein